MRIHLHPTDDLPFGTEIKVVRNEVGISIFVDENASTRDICSGLEAAVGQFVRDHYLYVGGDAPADPPVLEV